MSFTLHPAAESELSAAASYYAREASAGVARAFLVEFERVMELIEKNQRFGTPAIRGLRVYPFHRFPYSVIYREADVGPHVYAIAHQRREPEYWRGRK